jgi:uncharacterized protein YyaL (SSP411 family)
LRNEARNPGDEAAFADRHGGFYSTAAGATDVPLTRPRSAADNVTPSGNGMMAEVFARLLHLTGQSEWHTRATAVLKAFGRQQEQLTGMPSLPRICWRRAPVSSSPANRPQRRGWPARP